MVDIFFEFLKNSVRLIFVINPFVLIPIFKKYVTSNKKNDFYCMFQATLTAFFVLAFFAVIGAAAFAFMGISGNSFSIAGGMLLSVIGIRLMMSGEAFGKEKEPKPCFSPMGIPYIAGPGAITATTIMSQNDIAWKNYNFPILTLGVIIATLFVTLIILYFSNLIMNKLGREEFWKGIEKIMGIIITAIGVEFIVTGILGFIHTL